MAGIGVAALVPVIFILLAILFWSPIKLYGIHREAKRTNELLMRTNELLGQIISEQSASPGTSSSAQRHGGNTT